MPKDAIAEVLRALTVSDRLVGMAWAGLSLTVAESLIERQPLPNTFILQDTTDTQLRLPRQNLRDLLRVLHRQLLEARAKIDMFEYDAYSDMMHYPEIDGPPQQGRLTYPDFFADREAAEPLHANFYDGPTAQLTASHVYDMKSVSCL